MADGSLSAAIFGIAAKYRGFCYKIASRIPYGAVGSWVAFADDRMDAAFAERNGVLGSIKDYYVLVAFSIVLSLIAFWPFMLFMVFFAGVFGAVGLLLSPLMTVIGLLVALALLILAPAPLILLRAAFHYLIIRFFGGRASYAETLSILVKAAGAYTVLFVPFYIAYAAIIGYILSPLAYVVVFYAYYVQYKAVKHVHALPSRQAAMATVVAVVLEYAIAVGTAVALYFGMVAAMLLSAG